MKVFRTFEEVSGMEENRKLPMTIQAKQINEPFRVETLEGDYKQGKPGDYLMRGVEGELYICDKDIFEKTYVGVKKGGLGDKLSKMMGAFATAIKAKLGSKQKQGYYGFDDPQMQGVVEQKLRRNLGEKDYIDVGALAAMRWLFKINNPK